MTVCFTTIPIVQSCMMLIFNPLLVKARTNSCSLIVTFISVSVCSNVPGYEKPHCIVERDLDSVVQQMIEYITLIQHDCYQITLEYVSGFHTNQ